MSYFGKKKDQAPSFADASRKLRETEMTLETKSDFLDQKTINEMSMANKMGTKNKIAKLNSFRKQLRYEETSDYVIDFDPNEFVTSEMLKQSKASEAVKNLENGSKHSAPLETIEQLSLEESLEIFDSSIDVEEKSKNCEDFLKSSDGDKDALNNLTIDPTIQMEGPDVAGSSTFREHEYGNDEDMKVLNNWGQMK